MHDKELSYLRRVAKNLFILGLRKSVTNLIREAKPLATLMPSSLESAESVQKTFNHISCQRAAKISEPSYTFIFLEL